VATTTRNGLITTGTPLCNFVFLCFLPKVPELLFIVCCPVNLHRTVHSTAAKCEDSDALRMLSNPTLRKRRCSPHVNPRTMPTPCPLLHHESFASWKRSKVTLLIRQLPVPECTQNKVGSPRKDSGWWCRWCKYTWSHELVPREQTSMPQWLKRMYYKR
jgi:hypothetical protein